MIRTALLTALLVGETTAAAPRDEAPDARTLCAELAEATSSRPTTIIPAAVRAESNRLVADASALIAEPSRRTVTAAIALLEQATVIDAGNAVAFARLSAAHGDSRRYADVPASVAAERRWRAATAAYALEPDNVIVLTNLAHSVMVNARDLDCAERILLSARSKAPQDPDVNFGLSNVHGSKGDFTTAFADLAAAIDGADPAKRLTLQYNAGRLHLMARDYRWVINHYAVLIESNPDHRLNWLAYFYRGLAFAAHGNFQQALVEIMRQPPRNDGDAGALANLARIQILAGERRAGEANLRLLLERDARGEHVVSYQIAAIYEALDNRDEAFRWLTRYTQEVDGLGSWLLWLRHDPRWDRVRDDPRFAVLLVKAGPTPTSLKPSA